MNPAGGAEAAGSHWRSGPELVSGRTLAKIQGGGTEPGTGMHPMSRVNLIAPRASATKDWTPNGWVTVYVTPGVRPFGTTTRKRANTPAAASPSAGVSVGPPKPP